MLFTVELEFNASYYREKTEQGEGRGALKRELKAEIEDQVEEYNWDMILDNMIAFPVTHIEGKYYVERG